jgi:hypothetical protein
MLKQAGSKLLLDITFKFKDKSQAKLFEQVEDKF